MYSKQVGGFIAELMEDYDISYWWIDSYRKNKGKTELIRKLLELFKNKAIEEQLKIRDIRDVLVSSKLTTRRALLISRPDAVGFSIVLQGKESNWLNWSMGIGHELAHTFFYKLDKQNNCYVKRTSEYWEEENFCEDFALEWTTLNKKKLPYFLKRIKDSGSDKKILI